MAGMNTGQYHTLPFDFAACLVAVIYQLVFHGPNNQLVKQAAAVAAPVPVPSERTLVFCCTCNQLSLHEAAGHSHAACRTQLNCRHGDDVKGLFSCCLDDKYVCASFCLHMPANARC